MGRQKVILIGSGKPKEEIMKAINILKKANCEIIMNDMDEVKSDYNARRILEVKNNELIESPKMLFIQPPTRAERRKEKMKKAKTSRFSNSKS